MVHAANLRLGEEPPPNLRPPRGPEFKRDTLPSFAAAVAMHALLVLGMWFAVQWRTSSESPAVAELWDLPAAVQPPTPAPPPPPPPQPQQAQPKPDIAIPQMVKPRAPKEESPPAQRRPPEKHEPKKTPTAKPKEPTPEQLEREERASEERRQQELSRLAEEVPGTARAAGAPGTSISRTYQAMIIACIRPHVVFSVPADTSPNVFAEFHVQLLPTGEQAAPPQLVKPSGLPGYDDAAERAIIRCDPFPRDVDGSVRRDFTLKMFPTETR